MIRSPPHIKEGGNALQHSASEICNALYLTPPGKLWNNHMEIMDEHAFQQKVNKEVYENLAVHTPRGTSTSLHKWRTWGLWIDGYTSQATDVSSNLRVEWQSSSETFANTRTDSILDEYMKTCEVPLRGKQYVFQHLPTQTSLKHVKERLRSQNRLPSENATTTENATSLAEKTLSPFEVYHRMQKYKMSIKRLRIRYDEKTFVTRPQKNTGPEMVSKFDFTACPLRLEPIQMKDGRPSPCSTHPWYQATALWERLERFLESKYVQHTHLKATEYKEVIQTIVRVVRKIVTRGQSAIDFRHQCEESLDLLDVAPTFDNFMKRTDYIYTTSKTLHTDFHKSVQMLFGSSDKHMNAVMMLIRVLHPRWNQHLNAHNQMDVSILHTLLTHIQSSHSNEHVRKQYIKSILPKDTPDDKIALYSNRYEQIVRAQYMSESAFRKEQHILTVAYSLLQLPKASVLQQIHQNAVRTQKPTHTSSSVKQSSGRKKSEDSMRNSDSSRLSSKTKTLHIQLNATDRVPQKVDVQQKKVHTRSISKKTTTDTMPNLVKETSRIKNSSSTVSSPDTSMVKTQTGGAKKGSVQKKERTITLMTSMNKKNKSKSPSDAGQKKKTNLIRISKHSNPSNLIARYLTTREVETYRMGLHRHIKQKGGKTFVSQLQQSQQKKNPHFEYQDVVSSSSVHYNSIQKKLKLSAKNRNALRRVKRSVLRKYGGGNHTFKKTPVSQHSSPATNTSNASGEYMGSLYTRKHSGGSQKNTPRITWNNTDSLGDTLRDTSQSDMKATEGLTSIDLTNLESVEL